LRRILLLLFYSKKICRSTQTSCETYGDHALSETTCRHWFRRSKNNNFDVEDKKRSGARKKYEDKELEALLHEDSCQTLAELAESLRVDHTTVSRRLKVLGMIQKQGPWVLYELKPRDVKRVFTCESCFRRKGKIFAL